MSGDSRESVTVSIRAGGDERTVELPAGFISYLEEPGESAADVIADLVLFSAAQRTYEVVHFSEGGVPDEIEAINDHLQDLFEAEFGVALQDVAGYPDPPTTTNSPNHD